MEDVLKKEVVYKIDNMEDVNILKDMVYKTYENKKLLMDMYSSKSLNEKSPVVVLVHGEAHDVNFKEVGQYVSLGKLVAASGLKAVTFNHRVLSDGFTIDEVNSDVNQLLKYVIENADKLNIDKARIAIWCFSGGVPFGLYAGINNFSHCVKCIAAYYGIADFKVVAQLLDINIKAEEIKKYSPINFIDKNSDEIPPMFIARAGLDNPILNDSLDKFIIKAFKNNLTVDVYNHSTGGHAFDLFNDNDRTREIIAKTLDFFKKYLIL